MKNLLKNSCENPKFQITHEITHKKVMRKPIVSIFA